MYTLYIHKICHTVWSDSLAFVLIWSLLMTAWQNMSDFNKYTINTDHCWYFIVLLHLPSSVILTPFQKDESCLKHSVCSQVFLRPKFLVMHIAEHRSHNDCHVCNKTLSKCRQLKLHLNGHSRVVFGKKWEVV